MVYSEKLASIYFDALKGGIYHSLRADFFVGWRFRSITITFVIGLAAIIIAKYSFSVDVLTNLLSGAAFIISFLSFAFNFTDKIYFHKSIANRWKDLARAIDDKKSEEEGIRVQDYELFIKEYNLILRDEPLLYFGLDAVAHNSASRKLGSYEVLVIPWYVSLFRNYKKFSDRRFSSIKILRPKSKATKGK